MPDIDLKIGGDLSLANNHFGFSLGAGFKESRAHTMHNIGSALMLCHENVRERMQRTPISILIQGPGDGSEEVEAFLWRFPQAKVITVADGSGKNLMTVKTQLEGKLENRFSALTSEMLEKVRLCATMFDNLNEVSKESIDLVYARMVYCAELGVNANWINAVHRVLTKDGIIMIEGPHKEDLLRGKFELISKKERSEAVHFVYKPIY